MADTEQQPAQVVHHDKPTKHIHHGRTKAAWVGTTVGMVAFLVGGIAVVIQNWVLLGIAFAIAAAALIAVKVLQVMGHGAD